MLDQELKPTSQSPGPGFLQLHKHNNTFATQLVFGGSYSRFCHLYKIFWVFVDDAVAVVILSNMVTKDHGDFLPELPSLGAMSTFMCNYSKLG